MRQGIQILSALAVGSVVFSGVSIAQSETTSPTVEERSVDNPPGRTGVSRTSNTGSAASGAASTPSDSDLRGDRASERTADQNTDQTTNRTADRNRDQASDQQLDSADQDFLENAAQSGHTEIEGSRMAQEKAHSSDVKQFAEQMIKDHSAVDDELKALAKAKGYTPPTEPSIMQKAELKTLSMTDDGFDKMYASRIGVAAHEDAVKLFQKGANEAKDTDVKAFAQKTLPKLEQHLEMAKALKQKVESAQ